MNLTRRKRLDIWWRYRGYFLLQKGLWHMLASSIALALALVGYAAFGTPGAIAIATLLPSLTVAAILLMNHRATRRYEHKKEQAA